MNDRTETFDQLLSYYWFNPNADALSGLVNDCDFSRKDKMVLGYIIRTSSPLLKDIIDGKNDDLEFIVKTIGNVTGLDNDYLKPLMEDLLNAVDARFTVRF